MTWEKTTTATASFGNFQVTDGSAYNHLSRNRLFAYDALLAWLSLSVAQADPCDEPGRAIDVLVPAVRGSIGFLGPGMRADQPCVLEKREK